MASQEQRKREEKKPVALSSDERKHLEDSMRHNDKLMKRLAQM
jgi:hypothetical protein